MRIVKNELGVSSEAQGMKPGVPERPRAVV